MLERLALIVALSVALALGVIVVRRWNARRVVRLQRARPDWTVLGTQPDGRRTLIAFSTPSCAACHKAQAPAIDLVRAELGEQALRVIRVDAARQPRAAPCSAHRARPGRRPRRTTRGGGRVLCRRA